MVTAETSRKLRAAGQKGMGVTPEARHRRAVLAGRLSRAEQTLRRAEWLRQHTGEPVREGLREAVRIARTRLAARDARQKEAHGATAASA